MERDPKDSKLQLGQTAPYFSLPATDGKIYSLSDFSDAAALAVVFTSNHCPYARAYERRISALSSEFKKIGVALVAICSNDGVGFPEDSFEQMVEKSKKLGFSFHYLQDESQSVAKAYDARSTPEAYLFDSDKCLRYHGAIDDNHADADRVIRHYLREAAEAVLAGKKADPETSIILGCSIKWRA